MTKKDVLELKRRLKKNEVTFTKMCGCYVNAEGEIILNIEETFLNLKEEEFYKYLDIAKKTLSGTIGNNLLELEFPIEEEQPGGKQQFLMGLKESRLRNPGLLETFYRQIIDNYDYAGNYLILVFHDAYDVMTKTTDNAKLDESEEVYEYLLTAICPVELSKPGLGYLEDENRIGPRNRDWVVGAPDSGFIFPAFTDRSTDIHSLMFFTKNAKEPHKELMEFGLGCPPKQTATEQKKIFQTIINSAITDEAKSNRVFMEIQEGLNQIIDEQELFNDSESEPVVLTSQTIQEILVDTGLPEEVTAKIETAYEEHFGDTPPVVDHLIDSKTLAQSAQKKKEMKLQEQVQELQEKLEQTTRAITTSSQTEDKDESEEQLLSDDSIMTDDMDSEDEINIKQASTEDSTESERHTDKPNYDVIVRVKPQKLEQIKSEIIDGKKYILIPMDEDEHANVNGVVAEL